MAAGIVNTQTSTASLATSSGQPVTLRAAPAPTIAPLIVWVVETGTPSAVAKRIAVYDLTRDHATGLRGSRRAGRAEGTREVLTRPRSGRRRPPRLVAFVMEFFRARHSLIG
jgi:hypothetical protein